MAHYTAQLQPDYFTGTSQRIVIQAKNNHISLDELLNELHACGLKRTFEPNEGNEVDFDLAAEFSDDFLLIHFEEDWKLILKPANDDTILYHVLRHLKKSENYRVIEDLKHPVFANIGALGKVWACIAAAVGIVLIFRIDQAPGNPNITGWQLAVFAVFMSAFATTISSALGQAGASLGSKFPKPVNLNYILGEFAIWIFIFFGAFSL